MKKRCGSVEENVNENLKAFASTCPAFASLIGAKPPTDAVTLHP